MFNKPNNKFYPEQFPSAYTGNSPYDYYQNQANGQPLNEQTGYNSPRMMSPSNYPGENFSIAPGAPLPADQTSQLETVPRYARGGHVRNMNDLVDYVRMQGQRADKVLAHINPAEAAELDYKYGSDINPITGLPQFGKKSQPREAQVAQNMRTWEGSEKNKNIRMTELANLVSKRAAGGISQQVILDAMKNPANMATLLNLTGIPTDQALAMVNGLAPTSWDDYGGEIPKGGMGDERSMFSKALKYIPAAIGSVGGGMLGGPLGATAGGALGGSMARGEGNKLKGSLVGGGLGLGYSTLAPMVGSAVGVNPESMLGSTLMMQSPSLLNQLGDKNAPETEGGIGLLERVMKGGADAESSGLFGLKGAEMALLAAAILGALGRREKIPEEKESMGDYIAKQKQVWGPQDQPKPLDPIRTRYVSPPDNYKAGIDPEHGYIEYYSKGGHLNGHRHGQADDVPALLSDGEFVVKAPVVSAVGGGNNNSGAKVFSALQDAVMKYSAHKGYLPGNKGFVNILTNEMKKVGIK